MAGPLAGLRVVELGGIGPVPHAGMLLADLGARVLRVERPSGGPDLGPARAGRAAAWAAFPAGRPEVRRRGSPRCSPPIDSADVLLDGFRPGVAERLGVGPDVCLARRPELIYCRLTGWGQTGPGPTGSGTTSTTWG